MILVLRSKISPIWIPEVITTRRSSKVHQTQITSHSKIHQSRSTGKQRACLTKMGFKESIRTKKSSRSSSVMAISDILFSNSRQMVPLRMEMYRKSARIKSKEVRIWYQHLTHQQCQMLQNLETF
jgi:hypothetical protein